MIRITRVSDAEGFAAKIARGRPQKGSMQAESIIRAVRKDGDAAVKRYEKRFTGASLRSLRVSASEIRQAYGMVSGEQLAALRAAKSALESTERATRSALRNQTRSGGGIRLAKRFVPIRSVGCYIPGGLARYPSSAIMSIVPAKVAGVRRIVAVSPPDSGGRINPLTLVAAHMCGADEIYKTGGAQSIAALSYGTRSIRRVDKIVGPGGAIVTSAKSLVSRDTAIDMLAGPTELGIVADGSANPEFVALDMISQAEHSADTLCYMITNSERLARRVDGMLSGMISDIPRGKLVESSLKKNGFAAVCKTINDAIRLANELAPEHLQVMTKDAARLAPKITGPGLVLLGNYTPSAASDYILGSNHILPTSGSARTRGSLSVLDFLKVNTQVTATRASLSRLSGHLGVMADAEDLPNHRAAVEGRI